MAFADPRSHPCAADTHSTTDRFSAVKIASVDATYSSVSETELRRRIAEGDNDAMVEMGRREFDAETQEAAA
jgi:hypothetical protein